MTEQPKPVLVTYRCIVKLKRGGPHGQRIAGIVNDDGRPLLGRWNRDNNSSDWIDEWYLDEGKVVPSGLWEDGPIMKLIDGGHIICDTHGPWTVPRAVLLDHWETARHSSKVTIKLDETSPWRSRDIW